MNVFDLFMYVPKVILIAIVIILTMIVAEIVFLIIKSRKKKNTTTEQEISDSLEPVQFPGSTSMKSKTQSTKMNAKKKTPFSPMLYLFGGIALIILIALAVLTAYLARARLKIGDKIFTTVPAVASDYQIGVTLF